LITTQYLLQLKYKNKKTLIIKYQTLLIHFCCSMLKKYSDSKMPSSGKSVQWTAFLTLSIPKIALKELGFNYFAISGSWGPHKSLNYLTEFSYLISKTIQGPVVKFSEIALNSGNTPLYTSKNSSDVGLSKKKHLHCTYFKPFC